MHKSVSSPAMSASPTSVLSPKPAVHFLPPPNLSSVLADFETNRDVIDGFITHMKNQRGSSLLQWLDALERNVSFLKPKLEPFVMALLGAIWDLDDPKARAAFKHFLATLITAHVFYTRPIVTMLVSNLVGRVPEDPSFALEARIFEVSLETIGLVLNVAPIAVQKELVFAVKATMPYMLTKELNRQSQFIKNCLRLCDLLGEKPQTRLAIFNLVIERLVHLDALLPPINGYEDEGSEYVVQNETVIFLAEENIPRSIRDRAVAEHTLDRCMVFAFEHIARKIEEKRSKGLYSDLQYVFKRQMLPTHNTGHTHFLILLFLALEDKRYLAHFTDTLWSTFLDCNSSNVVRQACMAYLASLLARAKFVDLETLKQHLQKMITWCHHYINKQDRPIDIAFADLKAHGPFYSCCQSAFYLLTFRHSELVQREDELSFLRRLSLNSIITSPLNPLNVVVQTVVKNFCTVARHYQFAYCDSIVQRNKRLTLPVVNRVGDVAENRVLDAFFPFDPFLLRSSKHFVDPIYRQYEGTIDNNDFDDDAQEENQSKRKEVFNDEEALDSSQDFIDLCLGDMAMPYET